MKNEVDLDIILMVMFYKNLCSIPKTILWSITRVSSVIKFPTVTTFITEQLKTHKSLWC